ncbi:FecCD family ABC transporter permease [Pseudothermotoga thermarum]|uniref:Transport system permease protein n=1 Tax=Pseudothermotoga thermarum DSM 5069 TaxID=688269 RepID=F7YYN6_9THEM|nr:iron ABC transporter permease [Pseudothermotoga thermarum]AEH51068.1 transport system permease protein [Pseudothermotoga thermarum DSM 5069]
MKWRILAAAVLLFATIVLCSMFGTVKMSFKDFSEAFFFRQGRWVKILWDVRLPRVVLSVVAGAGLAAVGGVLQGLLRNPLVDPYLLGVSSGASFGAVLSLLLASYYGYSIVLRLPIISFSFAVLASSLALILARRNGTTPTTDLILSGVLMSILFSSGTIVAILLVRKTFTNAHIWLYGTFSGVGWKDIPIPLISTAAFVLLSVGFSESLNAIALGETQAKISGVNVEFVKLLIYIIGSFTTASIVSVTGTIGFVGLITPHVVRRLFGSNHKILIPLSSIIGGIFLCICDTFARTILSPSELPIGVVTAFVGTPVMLFIMKRGASRE